MTVPELVMQLHLMFADNMVGPNNALYDFAMASIRLVNQSDSPGDGLMMSRSDLTAKPPSALIDYHQNPAASPAQLPLSLVHHYHIQLGRRHPTSILRGGSSISDGSQSSIDLSQIKDAIAAVIPLPPPAPRARRSMRPSRKSAARPRPSGSRKSSSPTACQGIFIVDPDSGSVDMSADGVDWDDERGIVALRKYYALRREAEDTVTESKRLWSDTPFSVYALQPSRRPRTPRGCKRCSSTRSRPTARCRRSWARAGCARVPSPAPPRIRRATLNLKLPRHPNRRALPPPSCTARL
ncbi:hypothetical protein B0H14DRAFT_3856817, partial [Mycena olivaceomarginata]